MRRFLISRETLSVRMLDDSQDPTPLLKEIRDDKVATIIIDANASTSYHILRKVSSLLLLLLPPSPPLHLHPSLSLLFLLVLLLLLLLLFLFLFLLLLLPAPPPPPPPLTTSSGLQREDSPLQVELHEAALRGATKGRREEGELLLKDHVNVKSS